MRQLRLSSILILMTLYLLGMLAFICAARADQFMPHDKVMDGFVNAQRAPQMGRPVPYLPSKKMFHGKKHKKRKGRPIGEQQLGRKHSPEVGPTPNATQTPVQAPTGTPYPCTGHCGDPTGAHGPDGNGTVTVTDTSADLRNRDSTIKDQIGGLCTAYAGNAGVENLIGYKAPDLSEEYTFSLYGIYSVDSYATAVPGKALALNEAWPRGGRKSSSLSTTDHKLISISYLGDGEIGKTKAALRKGHPVLIGLEVPGDMASCLASIRPTTRVTRGGHAVLVVGYKDDSTNKALGGGYLIIKNSWTEGCGDHGYQYLPYSYCDKSYCYLYDMSEAK